MKKGSLSLLQKALLAIVLILLPIFALFVHDYLDVNEQLRVNEIKHNRALAEGYEGMVYAFLEMSKRRAQDFSSDGEIRSSLQGILDGKRGLDKQLGKYLSANKLPLDKTVYRIDIISLDDRVLASTEDSETGKIFYHYIQKDKDGASVSQFRAGASEAPSIVISVPILSKTTGRPIGVIANFLHLSELHRILMGEYSKEAGALSSDMAKNGIMKAYIVNLDGFLISGHSADTVLTQKIDTLPVIECRDSNKEMSGFWLNSQGVEVVGASMCMPEMGWTLLVEADEEKALKHVNDMLSNALTLGAIIASLILLLGILFFRKVLMPLRLLARAADSVADGDYNVSLPVQSHDELGELTNSFNIMAGEIRRRTEIIIEGQRRLSSRNHLYLTLSKINEAIVRINDRENLFKEACRIVVEDGDFQMSWIGIVDPSTLLVKPVAHCCGNYEGSYIDGLVVSVKDVPEGRGPVGTTIREGEHVICNDIENDPSMAPWRDKALRYGYRSSAAFPLRMGADVIGAMITYSSDPSFFNDDEIELLDTLVADISFAVESIESERQANLAKEKLLQSNTLLKTISRAQSEFISDIDTQVLFEGLLKDLLALTGSEYGFIGEMFYDTEGNPSLKANAISNIAWNDETRALYEKYAPAFEFRNLKSLFGEVMTTGKTVISNDPATDPRRCGLPAGHPPLNAFLGLPFYSGKNLIGMVGIANRQNGYDEEMVEYLQPFLSTCSNIIAAYRVKTQATQAEKERLSVQQRFEDLVNNLPAGIFRITPGDKGRFVEANPAFVTMLEAGSKEELFSHDVSDCYEDENKRMEISDKILKNGFIDNEEIELVSLKGNRIWASITSVARRDDKGDIYFDGVVENITEHKKLENQLLHSQKMEAVGQLAGGIAHDFNNALTAILGFGKLLLMKRSEDEITKNYVQHIIDAGESAASLVHGILTFSRKQTIVPKPIDITELVKNIKKIILRLIGEDIELNTVFSDAPMIVRADPTQIEQILMNLATNARDAMPDGGVITIGLEHVNLDDEFVKAHGYGEPGNYALLSFADTGMGIDEETRKKIFEPFFTTKEVGKGTGLGLAMVYGIVKQHEGLINFYSEPGKGTTFRIYLPIIDLVADPGKSREIILPPRGTETVLLIEDDEMVRAITLTVLEDFGYKVIVAENGEDAVSKFKENNDKIHLCISDMVMPKMGGREAYKAMRKIRPDLRVIFMSGYAADKTKGIIDVGLDFISKPVSPTDFLRKVREVLDR